MNHVAPKVVEALGVLGEIEKAVAEWQRSEPGRDRSPEAFAARVSSVVAIYCAHELRPLPQLNIGPGPLLPGSPLPFLNVSTSLGPPNMHTFEPQEGSFGFTCKHCGQPRATHS